MSACQQTRNPNPVVSVLYVSVATYGVPTSGVTKDGIGADYSLEPNDQYLKVALKSY